MRTHVQHVTSVSPRRAASACALVAMLVCLPAAWASESVPAWGQLPPSFEANRGQVDERVKYLARGAGWTLALTPAEAILALSGGHGFWATLSPRWLLKRPSFRPGHTDWSLRRRF